MADLHIPRALQSDEPWPIEPFTGMNKEIRVGGDILIDYDDVEHSESRTIARAVSEIPTMLRAIKEAIELLDEPHSAAVVLREAFAAATKPLEEHRLT